MLVVLMNTETDHNPFLLVSSSVAKSYKQRRFVIDEETWPPGQPTHYIEQNLRIHYQSQCGESEIESIPMPKSIQRNADDQVNLEDISYMHHLNYQPLQEDDTTRVTTEVTKIFPL